MFEHQPALFRTLNAAVHIIIMYCHHDCLFIKRVHLVNSIVDSSSDAGTQTPLYIVYRFQSITRTHLAHARSHARRCYACGGACARILAAGSPPSERVHDRADVAPSYIIPVWMGRMRVCYGRYFYSIYICVYHSMII